MKQFPSLWVEVMKPLTSDLCVPHTINLWPRGVLEEKKLRVTSTAEAILSMRLKLEFEEIFESAQIVADFSLGLAGSSLQEIGEPTQPLPIFIHGVRNQLALLKYT